MMGENKMAGFRQMRMDSESPHSILMASLSSLPSPNLVRLSHSISALLLRRLRRLIHLLISPALFSLTLLRLQSLSLHHKSLLLAHHLFSNLTLLLHFIRHNHASAQAPAFKLRDLDSALLLLLLCEVHHHDPHLLDTLPPSRWRIALCDYLSGSILRVSSLGGDSLLQFVESVGRCWNLVEAMCCRGGGKEEEEIATSAAAVVTLPSVEVEDGRECVICKEEMRKGREACELPCRHLFHWTCILRWLGKRNSCPCCRRRLPTDDVRHEIERLWDDLAEIGGG